MNTFRHCIADILASRQLKHVNGAPLYSYKLTRDEYESLQTALIDSLRSQDIACHVPVSMSSEWAGAFVMYAAEWWRKEFNGGHWSWEPIFSSLNISDDAITAGQRNKLIAAGFRFWRRPILSNGQGRMFLGSVAVEGGLPLKLITDPNSKLAHYFELVIKDFGKFTLSNPNAAAIAEAHDHCIAASFRTEAVYSVVGKIAQAIYKLTDQYGLDEQHDPMRFLDAVAPNWPEQLPLNIDHEVAKGLLNSALGQAIAVQRSLPSTIRLVRRLTQAYDKHAYVLDDPQQVEAKWTCQLAVSLRSRVNAQYIQQLFGMSSLPERFSLFAMGKKPLLLAKAFRPKNNTERYLLDVMTSELPNDWFDCEIQLMARGDNDQTWYAPLLGGSALNNVEPWVFTENEGEWVLAGSGDVVCESKKALIALSPEIALPPFFSGESVLGITAQPYTCRLYQLNEAGTYPFGDAVVELGVSNKSNTEYVWQGDELAYQTLPTKCFMGKPELLALSPQGTHHRLSVEKLRWHHASKQQWQPFDTLPLGQSEVAFIDGGKAKKRFRLASLPQDMVIEFLPGRQINRGQIVISSSRPPMVALNQDVDGQVAHQVTQTQQSVTLDLFCAQEQPPAFVELELWWQEKPKSVSITLPFPSKGVCLLDGDQKSVESHSDLLVDKINSYEFYGYGLDGEVELQFSLQAHDVRGAFSRSAYFSTVLPSIDVLATGLSLSTFRSDIQALFALSSSLDAKVKLSVVNHGQAVFTCFLSAYAHSLQPNREQGWVELAAEGLDDKAASIDLYTVPLDRPDQTPLQLLPVDDAERTQSAWLFPNDEVEAGAWLVYCDNPQQGIRPLMWSKDLELLPQASHGFEAAAGIGRRADRLEAFSQVAKEMAYDFSRSEWKFVRTLLSFDHVPLTTFDLWRGVSRQPEFMLALLLTASKKEIDQVWKMDKQFPLLWYSLKVTAAAKVMMAFYDHLLHRLGDDMADVAQTRVQKKLSELVSYFPGLAPLSSMMQFKIGVLEQKPALTPAAYMQHVFDSRNALSQRQLDADWPTIFADGIMSSVISKMNPQFVQLCLTNKHRFKNNVMNAPALLALATSGQAELSMTPEVVHAMREYRRFDQEYFDDCFALTQKMIIGLASI
ncbi:STY4851/ECs_5259 family protein [Photobacterium satsumensis]|uniref:STY4851/ECs_5259 family protein n=1 Tax=Photobacterium satsumensis TaxID=2910239 RepID=UPI003D117B46